MIFTAVGDMAIQRRLPPDYPGFSQVVEWMAAAQTRYFNLETTIHREGECYGASLNGGSYLRVDPEYLEDCKRYGFNMTTLCNNHSLDFGCNGVVKTLEYINKTDLIHAGLGMNLDQAAAPAYLEACDGRVAIIGMASSCNSFYSDVAIAGKQSRRIPGRPGVNQLRFKETLLVTQEQMDVIQQIAAETQVNGQEDIVRKEGYRDPLPEGTFKLGKYMNFELAEKTGRETKCDPRDMKRLEESLYEAKGQADFVLVAIHSHEISGLSKEQPAQFVEEFARRCIDLGADAVIGHGPHLLRPIEIYKNRPIFYSLGDFILHTSNVPFAPEETYMAQGLTSDAMMQEVRRKQTKDFTRGLLTDRRMLESVIPRWEIVDGVMTKLELLPIELGFGMPLSRIGLPAPAKDDSILRRLAEMSAPYGTKISVNEQGIGIVDLT